MSYDPIERAARAICEVLPYFTSWEESEPYRREICMGAARAAIATMDEIPPSVMKAVLASARDHGLHDFGEWDVRFTLGAVVEAILAEHEKIK